MKLLLDENLPHQLRHELPGHECSTAAYMGWAGKRGITHNVLQFSVAADG